MKRTCRYIRLWKITAAVMKMSALVRTDYGFYVQAVDIDPTLPLVSTPGP